MKGRKKRREEEARRWSVCISGRFIICLSPAPPPPPSSSSSILTLPSISTESKKCTATLLNACSGHSVNQSMVQQLTKEGNMRRRYICEFGKSGGRRREKKGRRGVSGWSWWVMVNMEG